MNRYNMVIASFVAIVTAIAVISISKNSKQENFTAPGWIYNVPPNWFIKQNYNPSQWLVREYIDKIQPECVTYNVGAKYEGMDNLNYLGSAYRFWRM